MSRAALRRQMTVPSAEGRLHVVGGENREAVFREVVPGTLRSLYLLRIGLYVLSGLLALLKVALSAQVSAFLLDLCTDSAPARALLESWVRALGFAVSGLLASAMALVAATFLIQGRLMAQIRRELSDDEQIPRDERETTLILRTVGRESVLALAAGVLAVALSELLARGAHGTAIAAALLAAIGAGALDTLYFHLLFLLRDAPVHAAEQRYREVIDESRVRLEDGSMRLYEALLARFEADYRRTVVAARSGHRASRQVREARRQFQARLWVVDRVIPGGQLVAFTAQARNDPDLLERWTEEVDWLIVASREVQRRQRFLMRWLGFLRPGELARQTLQERLKFSGSA